MINIHHVLSVFTLLLAMSACSQGSHRASSIASGLAPAKDTNTTDFSVTGEDALRNYVSKLYSNFLGRAASKSEIDGHIAMVTSKTTPRAVALRIIQSGEGRTAMLKRLSTPVAQHGFGFFVRDLSLDSFWVSQFRRPVTDGALRYVLNVGPDLGDSVFDFRSFVIQWMRSDEALAGARGDFAERVRIIYRTLLLREASDAEVKNGVLNIRATGLTTLIRSLVNTPRFAQVFVTFLYQHFLNRTPTLAEIEPWVRLFQFAPGVQNGDVNTHDLLLAGLLSSREYSGIYANSRSRFDIVSAETIQFDGGPIGSLIDNNAVISIVENDCKSRVEQQLLAEDLRGLSDEGIEMYFRSFTSPASLLSFFVRSAATVKGESNLAFFQANGTRQFNVKFNEVPPPARHNFCPDCKRYFRTAMVVCTR